MTHGKPPALFALDSSRDEVLLAPNVWRRAVGTTVFCPGCWRPREGHYPAPISFVTDLRQRASLSSGDGVVEIVRPVLFQALVSLRPGIIPGEVRLRSGRQLDSVTLHFPPSIELNFRGGHATRPGAYGICEVCGRVKANRALMAKPWYVLSRDTRPGDVFVTNEHMIIVSERAKAALETLGLADLRFNKLLVLDEPLVPVPELGDEV